MNSQQALALLNQAAGMAPLNREAHVQIQQAIKVLEDAINPKKDVPNGKVPPRK